jgi:hypothetical protein
MPASICLEAIGDDATQMHRLYGRVLDDSFGSGIGNSLLGRAARRCWVARITGLDKRYGFRREFIRGQTDYSQANSIGSRGVFIWYHLADSGLYEIKAPQSWRSSRRYFARVVDNRVVEISRERAVSAAADMEHRCLAREG